MDKLGEVIRGLECCIETSEMCWDNPKCPYNGCGDSVCGEDCMSIMMRDALALLKAQEPRVMTLEEYDAWTGIPFTERDPVFHEERTKRGTVTCWVNTTVCSLSEYGKNDRCWTSRPTDEQREATPWK